MRLALSWDEFDHEIELAQLESRRHEAGYEIINVEMREPLRPGKKPKAAMRNYDI